MKILNIRLKNLNSLRGEWEIDLTHDIYTSEGIFAITGPTGAGKTTIFDAVCLALYGKTPRLSKVNSSENEIMSKGTGTCFAHVTFSTEEGTFMCKWEQNRKGKRPGGKLEDAAHHLERYMPGQNKGEVITENHTTTLREVEKITGLNFGQFKQAVLLAQGDFDAFLKANAGERSYILELLTGTEIYGKISTAIYDRKERERIELEKIKIQLENKKPGDKFGSEDEIIQKQSETSSEISHLTAEHDRIQAAVKWLRDIQEIKEKLDSSNNDINNHQKIIDNFTAERKRLEAGQRANEIEAVYASLKEKRKTHKSLSDKIEKLEQDILKETSELARIKNEKLPALEAELAGMTDKLPESETTESIYNKAMTKVEAFKEIAGKKPKLEAEKLNAEKEYHEAEAFLKSAEDKDKIFSAEYEEARKKLSELMNVKVSAILEEEKRKLKPGEPCPICGSREHPLLFHKETENSTAENIFRFDDELKKCQNRERTALKNSNTAKENFSQAQNNKVKCMAKWEQCIKDFEENAEKTLEAKSAVTEIIELLGIYNAKSCNEITARINMWHSHADSISQEIKDMKDLTISLESSTGTNKKNLAEEKSNFNILSKELEETERNFAESLKAKNFRNEDDFIAASIKPEELSELQKKAKSYDDEMNRLQAVKSECLKRLNDEKEKSLTSETLDKLEPEFKTLEDKLKELNRQEILLKKALEDRKSLQKEIDELNEKYNTQQEIYTKWSEFDKRLGQKNGNKYRKFAQRITLRMMIELANTQLKKMNNRYTLIASSNDGDNLDLSVIDSEQAGEIRPTDNLSGGERFIISLALALGLSQISGSKARVDSLFLDEGFGTLDDEALNSALEALGEVRREGRMIGIISHVSGISDRIRAQINVIRKSEGTSIIKGPGCSRLTG